jgi:hypothetical protein
LHRAPAEFKPALVEVVAFGGRHAEP